MRNLFEAIGITTFPHAELWYNLPQLVSTLHWGTHLDETWTSFWCGARAWVSQSMGSEACDSKQVPCDPMTWKRSPHWTPFVRGIHQSRVNSLHKGSEICGVLVFSLMLAWLKTSSWRIIPDASDLKLFWDVNAMMACYPSTTCISEYSVWIKCSLHRHDIVFLFVNIYVIVYP